MSKIMIFIIQPQSSLRKEISKDVFYEFSDIFHIFIAIEGVTELNLFAENNNIVD